MLAGRTGVRCAMAPCSMDSTTRYLAAQRVAHGRDRNVFPLFGRASEWRIAWLAAEIGVLAPGQFWILTTLADAVTLEALFAGVFGSPVQPGPGITVLLAHAVYPFAMQQSAMFIRPHFKRCHRPRFGVDHRAERGLIQARTIAALAAGAALASPTRKGRRGASFQRSLLRRY